MKLSPEQLLEKKSRENIKRLINRVSSEYSFKKWRNYHSYLRSIGSEKTGEDRELSRPDLDELLRQYEEQAFKFLSTSVNNRPAVTDNKERGTNLTKEIQKEVSSGNTLNKAVEEKQTDSNNYGLSKSEKEMITLFWFQKKAAADLLKGFTV